MRKRERGREREARGEGEGEGVGERGLCGGGDMIRHERRLRETEAGIKMEFHYGHRF